MQKKQNGRTLMHKSCEEKPEIWRERVLSMLEKYTKETYGNLIMLGIIPQVLSEMSERLCEHDMRIESGSHHTKDTEVFSNCHPKSVTFIADQMLKLVDIQPAPTSAEPMEKNMFDDDFDEHENTNMHRETQRWFLNELEISREHMLAKAREEYINGNEPDSLAEAIKKIQDGDFTVRGGYNPEDVGAHTLPFALRWSRHPEDKDSFTKARDTIDLAYRTALRSMKACVSYGGDFPRFLDKFEKTKWMVEKVKEVPKLLSTTAEEDALLIPA